MADIRKLVEALKVPIANQSNPYTRNGIPNVDLVENAKFVNSFMPISGDIQSGIQAIDDVKNKKYASALLNSVGLLPFVPALGGILENAKLTKKIGEGINEYKKDFGNTKIEYYHYKPENMIDITRVYTPPELRGKGLARDAMNQLLLETDKLGTTTQLVPTPMDKITNPEKLKQFYKSLGYEELPYSFGQEAGSMIRHPIER
jgi:predicted GNAT family acetyltransferase